jgi:hypothetical protein
MKELRRYGGALIAGYTLVSLGVIAETTNTLPPLPNLSPDQKTVCLNTQYSTVLSSRDGSLVAQVDRCLGLQDTGLPGEVEKVSFFPAQNGVRVRQQPWETILYVPRSEDDFAGDTIQTNCIGNVVFHEKRPTKVTWACGDSSSG